VGGVYPEVARDKEKGVKSLKLAGRFLVGGGGEVRKVGAQKIRTTSQSGWGKTPGPGNLTRGGKAAKGSGEKNKRQKLRNHRS